MKRIYPISFAVLAGLMLAFVPRSAAAFDTIQVTQAPAFNEATQVYVGEVSVADAITRVPRTYSRISTEPRPVSERDSQNQAQALRDELIRALGKQFQVVDAPGAGVVTIDVELTELASSRPTMADYRRQQGLSFDSFYAGGASVTMRVQRDGQTLATIEDHYSGTLGDGLTRISIWHDAERAYSQWGRKLSRWLAGGK